MGVSVPISRGIARYTLGEAAALSEEKLEPAMLLLKAKFK
ncbi:hypothetical protein CP8484711_0725 [Chlamydia psittaci 84-8471/1]|nr:hypothetical protein CP8484711_0725 [Chlamydia psittaci 84-8471/1]